MQIIFSVFLTGIFLLLILVLFFQGETNKSSDIEIDLEEWNCPECGFQVQMGDVCTYCYTKKRE